MRESESHAHIHDVTGDGEELLELRLNAANVLLSVRFVFRSQREAHTLRSLFRESRLEALCHFHFLAENSEGDGSGASFGLHQHIRSMLEKKTHDKGIAIAYTCMRGEGERMREREKEKREKEKRKKEKKKKRNTNMRNEEERRHQQREC